MMTITAFTKEMIPMAQALLSSNLAEECQHVPILPMDAPLPALDDLAGNGLTVAAVKDGKLLGFLGAYGPWKPVFHTKDTSGVFSPLHAHAVQKNDRIRIWQRLYQAAAELWVQAGAASHAITLYTHDAEAQQALYLYGFGVRCMDLMRPANTPVQAPAWECRELPLAEQSELTPLRNRLTKHLGQSPCFMEHDPVWVADWLLRRAEQPPRTFVAETEGRIVAYMEVCDEGENYVSSHPGTVNICGAYALPEYRGKQAAQALLAHILETVSQEGAKQLGVDCESFNPTALHFWSKYFDAYTYSVVRRVDEMAIHSR